MLKRTVPIMLSILLGTITHAEDNNIFIGYDGEEQFAAPEEQLMVAPPQSTYNYNYYPNTSPSYPNTNPNTGYYTYTVQPPMPTPVEASPRPSRNDDTNYPYWHPGQSTSRPSEVTHAPPSGEVVSTHQEEAPRPPPRPRDLGKKTPAKHQTNTKVYDLNGCVIGRPCWQNVSVANKIHKIIDNVEYINQLHNSHIDPRYFMCTGWRESTYNPGARGAAGERGMFQVMPATGKAALRYGPKVPGFTGLSADTYMTRMSNSTLAQTELSFLTLKMKVAEGASQRVLQGTASVSEYRNLARRYNGAGPEAERYANAIGSCFACLRSHVPSLSRMNYGTVGSCLRQAKR